MMKSHLLAMVMFALSNSTAFAACADDIPTQTARMTTSAAKQNEDIELLKSAFSLLKEAKTLCDQGNESGAANVLDRVKILLTDMGR